MVMFNIFMSNSRFEGDRLANESLCDAVAQIGPPRNVVHRVCLCGHAHDRYFVEDDANSHQTWVGAALSKRTEPVVLNLELVTK